MEGWGSNFKRLRLQMFTACLIIIIMKIIIMIIIIIIMKYL